MFFDDYFSKEGKYLGSDGATTNAQRVISAGKFYETDIKNNGTTSKEATAELQNNSKEITVVMPGGKTEGQYFKDLYAAGDVKTAGVYKEMSTTLLFDPENATLSVHTNSSIRNGPNVSVIDDDIAEPGIKIGDAHTHQVADVTDDRNRNIEVQGQDQKAARATGRPLFTIDSQNVDAIKPVKGIMGTSYISKDNIATTPALFNNQFSILKKALEYFGGKP